MQTNVKVRLMKMNENPRDLMLLVTYHSQAVWNRTQFCRVFRARWNSWGNEHLCVLTDAVTSSKNCIYCICFFKDFTLPKITFTIILSSMAKIIFETCPVTRVCYCLSNIKVPPFSLNQAYCITIKSQEHNWTVLQQQKVFVPVPGAGDYFQKAQPQFSAGPNLMCVSKTELCTSSRASQAAQLHCSGIWKSGTLVWTLHFMYFSFKSGAGSTRGFVVWKLYLVHWPTLHLILKVNGLSFT